MNSRAREIVLEELKPWALIVTILTFVFLIINSLTEEKGYIVVALLITAIVIAYLLLDARIRALEDKNG